jgi:hypothetical protein
VSVLQKDSLRRYLSDPASWGGASSLPAEFASLIRALPIFPVFGPEPAAYHTLRTVGAWPDLIAAHTDASKLGCLATKFLPLEEDSMDQALYDEHFVRCGSARERSFLAAAGARSLTLAAFFLGHVVPRLDPEVSQCCLCVHSC